MSKKLTALGLAFLFLGSVPMSASASAVTSLSDELRAARIQQREIKKCRERNTNYKMVEVQKRIKENEREIKRLENKRTEFDHELAVKLQLKEDAYGWLEKFRLSRDIKKISRKIELNEEKIKSLKEKRSELDHEYAVLLQLQED